MEINETLKELRQKKKLTQQELALLLDINLSSYQKYERSNNTIKPSLESLIKIADFYGVSVDYLLGREEKTAPNPLAFLNVALDEDEFINIYKQLPQVEKEILADAISKLAEANRQRKKNTLRTGGIESEISQELAPNNIIIEKTSEELPQATSKATPMDWAIPTKEQLNTPTKAIASETVDSMKLKELPTEEHFALLEDISEEDGI